MKALILAAGFGSRLLPLTENCPKSLIEVNGKPILLKQIENLYKNNIKDIIVVSGYKAEMLEEKVKGKYPEIEIIYSEDYKTTNNMYSAFLAKDKLKNEDFLMMNADVFFDESVITELLKEEYDNAIVTDIGNYFEESMKVVDKDGRLVRISKEILKDEALGASIDVYKFSSKAGETFFNKCEEYIIKNNKKNLWSEVALNDILDQVEFHACPLKGRWIEIDNHEDLDNAKKMFKGE